MLTNEERTEFQEAARSIASKVRQSSLAVELTSTLRDILESYCSQQEEGSAECEALEQMLLIFKGL